jgi:tRNA modification GTPase
MFKDEDTICAISTPPGMGGIGIVRLSGPGSVGIARHIFYPQNNNVGEKLRSHRIYYGKVVNPVTGEAVDEALMSVMLAPKTYTREDIVEINCHGGPVAVKKTLELAVASGARLAEPGEFTKRAFVNGRIDLTQAEAVMDVIASATELSLSAAVSQLSGGLKEKIVAVRDRLSELLALTEVSIDFSEEDIDYVPVDGLRAMGAEARKMVRALLLTYDEGRVLREGLRVAIVGAPNVGKSSLLNLLARAERAIVTEIPGTTRDTVEEMINLGGVPVRVIDTAGIRHSHDIVEREGIRRSEEALLQADLALLVLDGSRALTDEDRAIIGKVNKNKHIVIINKSDLPQRLTPTPLTPLPRVGRGNGRQQLAGEGGTLAPCPSPGGRLGKEVEGEMARLGVHGAFSLKGVLGDVAVVRLSAKTGEGLDELTSRVKEAIFAGDWRKEVNPAEDFGEKRVGTPFGDVRADMPMINLRHKGCLERAEAALLRFDKGCRDGLSQEFLAVELRDALDSVGEVVGGKTPEDVLDMIFSRFCIGK